MEQENRRGNQKVKKIISHQKYRKNRSQKTYWRKNRRNHQLKHLGSLRWNGLNQIILKEL